MKLRPKNWDTFQHYKDRRPPWIKLHHALVDDPSFHALKGEDAKYLMLIWLIASEDLEGYLPANSDLAWRLRISAKQLTQLLSRLQSWIVYDASKPLSPPEHPATPEKRREEEIPPARAREELQQPPDIGSDEEEERTIPDDIPAIPLGNYLLQRLSIPRSYALAAKFADAADLLARDEKLGRGNAAKVLLDRARQRPPTDGKWNFWLDDGGWKEVRSESGTNEARPREGKPSAARERVDGARRVLANIAVKRGFVPPVGGDGPTDTAIPEPRPGIEHRSLFQGLRVVGGETLAVQGGESAEGPAHQAGPVILPPS